MSVSRECKDPTCPVRGWRHYHVVKGDTTTLARRYPPDTGQNSMTERKPRRGILGMLWARR